MKNEKMSQSDFLALFHSPRFRYVYDDKPNRPNHLPKAIQGNNVLDLSWNKQGYGTFFTVNGFPPEGEATEVRLISLNGNYVDFDTDKGLSQELRDELIQEVLMQAVEAGIPTPTVITRTWKGIHAIWLYAKPLPPTPENIIKWRNVQERLVHFFHGDVQCKDPSRILRVPGTFHLKDPKNPFEVYVLSYKAESHPTLDELDAAVPKYSVEEMGTQKPSIKQVLAGVPVGKGLRHLGIAQVAGFFLRRATTREEVELARLALYAWDRDMNKSPERWEARKEELDASFNGILEKEMKRRGAKGLSSAPAERPTFTSLGDLLAEPEEETAWIVDELLPAGGLSAVVAKPKVGKSTLIRQLCLAIAQGLDFLGRKTMKGPVLYVSLEEKRSEVKNHFRLLGATGEEDLGIYVGAVPQEACAWLEAEIKNRKPVLVVIDTLFRFAEVADVADYGQVLAALNPLLALARENSAHLMLIHHARKAGGEGGDVTLGSTAIFGSVDTAIILKRTERGRTIETQQRYGTDIEPMMLVFDSETKHTTLGGSKEEADVEKIQTAILELLKAKKEPISEETIDNEVEGKTMHKRNALRDLVAKNEIFRTGRGRKGDPYMYSSFPVPTIEAEQEKQEGKTPENHPPVSFFSRSESPSEMTQSEAKVEPQDEGAQNDF